MKFQVPQFIEVEDKIFGPLTIKQFIYMAGGAGMSIIFYLFMPLWLSLFFIIPIMGFSSALAFYKINNKPFIFVVESGFKYFLNPKLYIWRHQQQEAKQQKEVTPATPVAFIPKLSESKLKDLSWSLDTKEAINPVTRDTNKES
ncbi:PrgI family protein [Patescibacteria group bacterium]|nr:PrgI family protein [Patescibacteria group bacterium]